MKLAMIIFIFIALSVLFVLSENNIALRNNETAIDFGKAYAAFAGHAIENAVKTAGYAVKLEWFNSQRQ
jgi:hypothetical protein